jgi:uncharacterized protein YndB with AHSA1/START domain
LEGHDIVSDETNATAFVKARPMISNAPTHVYELYIRATPDTIWSILTDESQTAHWQHFNMDSQIDLRPGGRIAYLVGGQPMIVGEVEEVEPGARLVHSFSAQWSPDVAADKPSRVTWAIAPLNETASKLTLTHGDFGGDTATAQAVTGGWPEAVSRLKTLAETGMPFVIEAPKASAPA